MAATSRGTTPEPPDARPRLTVLSGPSGVGKSTVVAHMRKEHPEVWLSVSATTRRPRPGEKHGVHYFFVTDEGMVRQLGEGRRANGTESIRMYVVEGRDAIEPVTAGERIAFASPLTSDEIEERRASPYFFWISSISTFTTPQRPGSSLSSAVIWRARRRFSSRCLRR